MEQLAAGEMLGSFPYRIVRQLGEGDGGMSVVYLAQVQEGWQSESAERLVALKIANVQSEHHHFYRATLDNEVEHLRALRHPGIVQLYRIVGPGLPRNAIYSAQTNLMGRPWFSVLEFLAGGSLAELRRESERLDVDVALRIAQQAAETLAFLHFLGHVHLDLKPENIVFRRPLAEGVESVLVDFGVARRENQGGLEAATLIWSPPERVAVMQGGSAAQQAAARPNTSMDIYAVGLLLYRMLTGRMPFSGSRGQLTSAILRGELAAPSSHEPTIPPALDALILAALAREPAARPHATQLAEQMDALRHGLAAPPTVLRSTRPATTRAAPLAWPLPRRHPVSGQSGGPAMSLPTARPRSALKEARP